MGFRILCLLSITFFYLFAYLDYFDMLNNFLLVYLCTYFVSYRAKTKVFKGGTNLYIGTLFSAHILYT